MKKRGGAPGIKRGAGAGPAGSRWLTEEIGLYSQKIGLCRMDESRTALHAEIAERRLWQWSGQR